MSNSALIPSITAGFFATMSFCSIVLHRLLSHHFMIHWRYHYTTDVDHPKLYLQDLRLIRKILIFSIINSSLLLFLIVLHFCGVWEVSASILWCISALVLLVIAFCALRNHDHVYPPSNC